MIGSEDMTRIDRQAYRAVHGRKVVGDTLKAVASVNGWAHRFGRTYSDEYEEWTRGRWTLRMEWSEGGRIKGAGLHEDQLDPDTGKVKVRPDGITPARFLRFGLVAGERNKKEHLMILLAANPNDMPGAINAINALRQQ